MEDSITTIQYTPGQIRDAVLDIKTIKDLAKLLEYDTEHLESIRSDIDRFRKYIKFKIPKKGGGERTILAPIKEIKNLQEQLHRLLQHVYRVKPSVHGFTNGRSIVTNAAAHKGKRYVFNLDLQDFFSTITRQRVQGMFAGKPYFLPDRIARFLANICCFKGKLPQGAPTSPIISNMLCAQLDSQLQRLAQRNKCYYTRYADDIAKLFRL